jgi:proline dehydrogenase
MDRLIRGFFLFLSKNKWVSKIAKRHGLHLGASRFVAGETIDEAAEIIKRLTDKHLDVTIDYLGEYVDSEREAKERTRSTIQTIEVIGEGKLNAQLSVKLTALGLDLSEELVHLNMRDILQAAQRQQIFVTIDMEDYSRCEKTLRIYRELRKEYDNVGTVIQAYLYRSVQDLEQLAVYHPILRLVKGAYKESAEIAYQQKNDVDKNFKKIIKSQLLNGHYTAVATHDEKIIEYTKQLVEEHHIPRHQFEFQMLYGIRPEKQLELVQEGYKMRVYVPFGTDWFGYFMRRLAERPENVAFLLKGLFKK